MGEMVGKYVPPKYRADAFSCPHCGAIAQQYWHDVTIESENIPAYKVPDLDVSSCYVCDNCAVWLNRTLLHPDSVSTAPFPSEDMPEDVKADFEEARQIVNKSPRAAAALLRLALQKLMVHLGEEGDNLNKDIDSLVKKGLPQQIQEAMDAVRVYGNESVHPGVIDLRDDPETAATLFQLVNWIVEDRISRPKRIAEVYDKIPDNKKRKIPV